MHELMTEKVDTQNVGIAWFGQNSFAVKTCRDRIILVDPYFPQERDKQKFLYPDNPVGVFEISPDIILLTHNHSDHTDLETLRRYSLNNSVCIMAPPDVICHLENNGFSPAILTAINAGETLKEKEITIHAIYSKQPEGSSVDAVTGSGLDLDPPDVVHLGYVIKTEDDIRVYVSGDCQRNIAECSQLWKPVRALCPDIGLLTTHPTEGEFPFFEDAIKLANRLNLTFSVPAHYECFSTRTYDPFVWQRKHPPYGCRPIIIPLNGYVNFSVADYEVCFGYSGSNKIPCSAEKTIWSGKDIYRLENTFWEALFDPSIGGNPIRLRSRKLGADILHSPMNFTTYENRPRIYGIPPILPPNRIKFGKFTANGISYDMVINSPDGHHCHGLIATEQWQVTDIGVYNDVPSITFTYENCEGREFFASFPHKFILKNRYQLIDSGLLQTFTCKNTGSVNMPFGLGFHTAINVPFLMDSRAGNIRVKLPIEKRWEIDALSIPTGYSAPLNALEDNYTKDGLLVHGLGIRDHYRGRSYDGTKIKTNTAVINDTTRNYQVTYKAGESFGHWMIWNDGGENGFVCPEPMTWAIDAPNLNLPDEKTGYRELIPGETWQDELSITLDEIQ